LALTTQTRLASGVTVDTLDFIAEHRLEGLSIPTQTASVLAPLRLTVEQTGGKNAARALAREHPEAYWYDEPRQILEVHRILDVHQYQTLLALSEPEQVQQLQRRFRDDMGDALELATRKYTAEEKDFLRRNRPELERALVLGRFFYHHSFIFTSAVALAQDPTVAHASQYGKGLTQGFALLLSVVPEQLRFNSYLLALYASYPLYFFIAITVGRASGLSRWSVVFVAATTLFGFTLSDIETVRLGVGLAPWRHMLDLVVLYALGRFGQRSTPIHFLFLAVAVFAGIYWSQEMGLFIGLSAVGVLVALAVKRQDARGVFPILGLAVIVVVGYLVADPDAQAVTWAVPLGANTPTVPRGFVSVTAGTVTAMLTAWLWLAGRLGSDPKTIGWWCMTGAAVLYIAANGIYVMYYPRPHHLAPALPVLALGTAAGWTLLARSLGDGLTGARVRLAGSSATALVLLVVVGISVLRTAEALGERQIFAVHVTHRWDFPAAQLLSTGDPSLLRASVELIRRTSPQASVDILSPWEAVLLPLAGKGKSGPFVLSFDSLLTDREVLELVEHLLHRGNGTLFVDSRLISGIYELPPLEDAYMQNRLTAAVLRLRAHVMLREVFSRIEKCYQQEEAGPLITAYKRISQDCLP